MQRVRCLSQRKEGERNRDVRQRCETERPGEIETRDGKPQRDRDTKQRQR